MATNEIPNEVKTLQQRFHALPYDSISDFCRRVSILPVESWGSVLFRNQRPGTKNFIIMMAELDYTKEEIAAALAARNEKGEVLISRIIEPSKTTTEENKLIQSFRRLDNKKRKLAIDMIESMA